MSEPPSTRPGAMTQEEAKRIVEKMVYQAHAALEHGGARVDIGVRDTRFSKLISWVWVAIGTAAIGVCGWGVLSINELNIKVGVLIAQHDRDSEDMRDLRERIHVLEQRR